ncbi:MAG: hydrogenase expression/formation protein HypE [bacterium JZ-2024 1]
MEEKDKEHASETATEWTGLSCPAPTLNFDSVLLAHGGGGRLMANLIRHLFLPCFDNPYLQVLHDGAIFEINGTRYAITTDSYVVSPVFFPGGDIGTLSIYGTANDLAMCGAKPLFLSAALILEEGFPMEQLHRIAQSMAEACRKANVLLVTGDTKVVNKGKGDGIFITTSGVGIIEKAVNISPERARPGDKILISGTIGDHGIAILSVREGLEFESPVQSDTSCLYPLVERILDVCPEVRCLRDPTRGGVASALNEIAEKSKVGIKIYEEKIPVKEAVKGACEILGLDPLYVANEGKLIAIVPAEKAERVLQAMKQHPAGKDSAIIGEVLDKPEGRVILQSKIGGQRVVDMLSGEQLPRIC